MEKQNKSASFFGDFHLEQGGLLRDIEVFYTIYGTPNNEKSNIVWVFHALTGGSEIELWWNNILGTEKLLDPNKYCIICANMIGSNYGSTGPLSLNPSTKKKYYHTFPQLSNRDIVSAFILLRKHLNIEHIYFGIGASLGGQQLLEWAIMEPHVFKNIIPLATNAKHSPWGIALNETQRMAILADKTWEESHDLAGIEGLKVARAIGLLSYRNYASYKEKQETKEDTFDDFRASSYQRYQGEKLTKRFNAFSYWVLTKSMDAHNVGRGRGGIKDALQKIQAKSLLLGINSDFLFPPVELKAMEKIIPNSQYKEILCLTGHDGFLTDADKVEKAVQLFLQEA